MYHIQTMNVQFLISQIAESWPNLRYSPSAHGRLLDKGLFRDYAESSDIISTPL